ncbi:RDD family protein [Bacillus sp. T33-2]|nr:RDD family protein [Bacillus sp. T33-2]
MAGTESGPPAETADTSSVRGQFADEPGPQHQSVDRYHTQSIHTAVRYAGFWMRFWAYLLDLIVIGSLNRLVVYPLFRAFDIPVGVTGIFEPVSIATAVIFYLYFVLMTKFFGQTLGKMVFGLKVIDLDGSSLTWGTVLFREWIGRFISATVYIGYLIVAFLPKKQGLHDLFTDTTVIHKG